MKLSMSAIFCRLTFASILFSGTVAQARDAKVLDASKKYQMTNRLEFTREFAANRFGSKSFVVLPDYDTGSIIEVMEHSIAQLTVTPDVDTYSKITIVLEPANKTFKARTASFVTSAENAELMNAAFKSKTLSLTCEFDLIEREKVVSLVFNQHTSFTLIKN